MPNYFRWVFGTDLHGDMADRRAVAAFHEFCKDFRPTVRIGSEFFDARPFRRDASEAERRESIKDDVAAALDAIRIFRPTVYLRGNHCERLWIAAKGDDGTRADLASQTIDAFGKAIGSARVIPYHKRRGIYQLTSRFRVLHGYHAGTYAARDSAKVYGSCLIGHVHTKDFHPLPGIDRIEGHASNALCRVDLGYDFATPAALRHGVGWAYGLAWPRTGEVVVCHAERRAGRWIIPTDFKQVA
jgi:hypothetical protein